MAINGDFHLFAAEGLLKREREVVAQVGAGAPPCPGSSTHAAESEEIFKDVAEGGEYVVESSESIEPKTNPSPKFASPIISICVG